MTEPENGNYVTQREFSREREDVRQLIEEIKKSLIDLHKKFDKNSEHIAEGQRNAQALYRLEARVENLNSRFSKIMEVDIPKLKEKDVALSTKQKIIWSGLIATLTFGFNIIVALVKGLIGLL